MTGPPEHLPPSTAAPAARRAEETRVPSAGLIVSAPASASGKTVFTLALLRHLARSGVAVASCKVGPDFIDPAYHAAASGRPCLNLDSWAMRAETLAYLATTLAREAGLVIGEGVMGLFDGSGAEGKGSTADLAVLTGWPVMLVIDVSGQAASAAAVVRGFAGYRTDVAVAGVVFNRVGGHGHEKVLRAAAAVAVPEVPVLGCLPRDPALALPERHLGLVQASEKEDLEGFLDAAAELVAAHVDIAALTALARPCRIVTPQPQTAVPVPPLGQRIAVARDDAFAFSYPAVLDGWRAAGAEVSLFSPLEDQSPAADADALYLPGGYPELHGGRLAGSHDFLGGLKAAAARGAVIYGECGGYMVLGRGLIDRQGRRHAMAGLVALETSFAQPRLHLGYRSVRLAAASPLGAAGAGFRGHEFHYASVAERGPGAPLFTCADASGRELEPAGLIDGRVMGSFIHLVDRVGE
ncbi:MAG: cobyrinate a,c-diamide synthase [Alphaproteobacteria bacterium]